MARYLITGSTIVNDMLYADGRKVCGFLGGTIYTVNGLLPYTDDLLFVSVAGPDFDSLYGDYFRLNGLDGRGVERTLPKTMYTTVEYAPSGEWHETSIYGEAYDRMVGDSWQVRKEYVVKHGSPEVKGIYFESAAGEEVWKGLDEMRQACPNAVFQWEVSTGDAEDPARRPLALELLSRVDLYSINRPEAQYLFGTSSEEESIEKIIAFGKPCFFRVGTKGSYMIQDGKAWFAPSVESGTSVDSTGCGNCSTGASLYGYCEGFHPLRTACYANVAAGVNARQYGPFPFYSGEVKKEMLAAAEALFEKQMQEVK